MTSQGSNGFAAADRWVGEIEKHQASVLDVMMRALRDCQPYHEMIRESKAAAKEAGIPIKLLNAALKERKLLRSVVKNRAELDEEISDDFDEFVAALTPVKDLPLFGAAIDDAGKRRAEKEQKRSSAVDSLSSDDSSAPDPAALAAETNSKAIKGGIKALN